MAARKTALKNKTRGDALKPLTLASLERSALFQLERRALTTAQLRRALQRKVRRSLANDNAAGWIDDVIARCTRSGLLDDTRVAEGRASALRAQGKSARMIAQKLKIKGVDDTTAAQVMEGKTGADDELAAARIYVRKRRLLQKDRQKALAALARQGFSFAVASRALADDSQTTTE